MKIALVGYYGQGNYGNRLIASAIQWGLRCSVMPLALAYEQRDDYLEGDFCSGVIRPNDPTAADFLNTFDLVIFGGGRLETLFGSILHTDNPPFYHWLTAITVPKIVLAASLSEPALGRAALGRIGRALRLFDQVTVRGELTARLLQLLPSQVVCDPVLAWPTREHRSRQSLKTIVIAPRLTVDGVPLATAAALLRPLLTSQTRVVFLPMQPHHYALPADDGQATTELARQLGITHPQIFNPLTRPRRQVWQLLADADLLVSYRMHATIMAALAGVPSVTLASEGHKMIEVAQMIGLETSVIHPADSFQQMQNVLARGGGMMDASKLIPYRERLEVVYQPIRGGSISGLGK